MGRRILLGLLSAVFFGLVVGCILQGSRENPRRSCTRQIFAMDTFMSFTAYGKNSEEAVTAAVEEVQRLDALLSTGSSSSEISKLNDAGRGTVSEDTAVILERALDVYETTGGMFDFTIYPLMKLWGFPSGEYHVPSKGEIGELLPLVDASQVQLDGVEVSLGEGQQVDLGGIAKGYTSARIMEIYKEYGITSGMVSLGGNIQMLNRKPDGSGWRVGIQDPAGDQGEVAAVLEAENQAVVTSGGYERYFEEDGNTYIHILDPGTGYPAEGDLASVTVVSADGTLADALSTALYIMGREGAVSYWKTYGEDFELVLITAEGEIYATEGIGGQLESKREVVLVERKK